MSAIRKEPCSACPYRQDVPSGLWAHNEYEKLRLYDAPTGQQPIAAFACHATPDHYCHGWAVVHNSRGHEHELLALRMRSIHDVPAAAVPLMFSGNDAADHGQADIDDPSLDAVHAIDKLVRKHPRLKQQEAQ
jgi:hypothetical protein